jgi:hypothetical protein
VRGTCLVNCTSLADNIKLMRYTYLLSYLLTHEVEPFLRSRQLWNNSRTSQHFMEPESSIPVSQEPSLIPIFSHINPIHTNPSYLSKIPRLGLPSGLFPSGFPINTLYAFLFSPAHEVCLGNLQPSLSC